MKSKDNILKIIDYFKNSEEKNINFDEEHILESYQKKESKESLPIKILSVLGGIFASTMFMGFLMIAGLYNSGISLMIFGLLCISISIWANYRAKLIIVETICVSGFIIGISLFIMGGFQLDMNDSLISILLILIGLFSLPFSPNYIISFLAVLLINGSILSLIIINDIYNFIYLYSSILAILMVYLLINEAKIISLRSRFSNLYNPIKTAIVFSLLISFIFTHIETFLPSSEYVAWIPSLVMIGVVVYIIKPILNKLEITRLQHKRAIYIFTIIILLPTALSAGISGAILLLLISFLVNYRTGFVLGIISFIYFISQFYYDLQFTLLTKSIILMVSGVLFIGIYWITHKKLTTYEKV